MGKSNSFFQSISDRFELKRPQAKLQNLACQTVVRIENDKRIYRPKKRFMTFDEAHTEATRLNGLPKTIHKFQAYKCKTCFYFHIGRTKQIINNTL